MSNLTKVGIPLVLVLGIVFQIWLRPLLFVTFGIGREMQPISDFSSYQCRRIEDPKLQACEDMWLSESTRQLFLACSDPMSRVQWVPNVGRLNASGRGLNDAVIAMDLDKPKGNSFEYRVLKTPKFSGVNGDGRLHLVGITGRDNPNSQKIDIYLTNSRPSLDPTTGALLKNEEVGADMTIEHFQTSSKSPATSFQHQKTFRDQAIRTPNNIALAPQNNGFYFTNDHGTAKAGLQFELANLMRNGDVSYCSSEGNCKTVAKGFAFPNGLIMGMDNRLYVPSAFAGGIDVFKVLADKEVEKVDHVDIPYPIDNLSQDAEGSIWAAGLPKISSTLAAFADPLEIVPPSTVFKINRRSGGWDVQKILEDRDAEVLPGATTAVHDAKTGRVFVSGIVSPFITVCEPKKV